VLALAYDGVRVGFWLDERRFSLDAAARAADAQGEDGFVRLFAWLRWLRPPVLSGRLESSARGLFRAVPEAALYGLLAPADEVVRLLPEGLRLDGENDAWEGALRTFLCDVEIEPRAAREIADRLGFGGIDHGPRGAEAAAVRAWARIAAVDPRIAMSFARGYVDGDTARARAVREAFSQLGEASVEDEEIDALARSLGVDQEFFRNAFGAAFHCARTGSRAFAARRTNIAVCTTISTFRRLLTRKLAAAVIAGEIDLAA
jgi:hypothetical protein